MDPRTNPYAPGAGTRPPELTGRNNLIEKADIAMERARAGLSTRGLIMVGLRGVGKTVLLNHLSQNAEAKGFATLFVEAPEKRSLPALLIPALRSMLLKLDRMSPSGPIKIIKNTLRVLGSFVETMRFKYADVSSV